MVIEVRPIKADEETGFFGVNAASFGRHVTQERIDLARRLWAEHDRTRMLGAFDDGVIAGTANSFAFDVTVPGGSLPLAGVSHVGVLPTHRRRGVLSALMRHQLDDLHERGEPLAGLYASESLIYGRFGYGASMQTEAWRIEREHAALLDAIEPPAGRVRLVTPEEARALCEEVFARARPARPGMIDRTAWLWERDFMDREEFREGASALFYAVYEEDGRPQGYAAYRVKADWVDSIAQGELRVAEVLGATREADEALWRYLFGIDLVRAIETDDRAVDDPLPWMLRDPRRLRRRVYDGLWLRLVDLPAALSRRCYAAPGSLVLEVRDAFCPWNEGRWRLEGGPEGARCERSDEAPDLALDADALAAAYLGGVRFATLAGARRIEERSAGALARADAMFTTPRAPWCRVFF